MRSFLLKFDGLNRFFGIKTKLLIVSKNSNKSFMIFNLLCSISIFRKLSSLKCLSIFLLLLWISRFLKTEIKKYFIANLFYITKLIFEIAFLVFWRNILSFQNLFYRSLWKVYIKVSYIFHHSTNLNKKYVC